MVARGIAYDTLQFYSGMIYVYTDGSKEDVSSTAAYVVPKSGQCSKAPQSYCPDTTTAELSATWLALTERSEHNRNEQLVGFTNSRGAFSQLQKLEKATPLAKNFGQLERNTANQGNTTFFQWITSYVEVNGNEKADALANVAHDDLSQTIEIHPFNYVRSIIFARRFAPITLTP